MENYVGVESRTRVSCQVSDVGYQGLGAGLTMDDVRLLLAERREVALPLFHGAL